MKRIIIILLILFCAGPLQAQRFSVPSGVTLRAETKGLVLMWEPIEREDLMGYSVWLRKAGEEEFTRIRIPIKVGKETKRMPMTSRAYFRFPIASDGGIRLKKKERGLQAEMVVRAEYENGKSRPSPSVHTRNAVDLRNLKKLTRKQREEKKEDPLAEEKAEAIEPTPEPTPFENSDVGERDTLLLKEKQWSADLGLGFEARALSLEGINTFSEIDFATPAGFSAAAPVRWKVRMIRNRVTVPLTLRYGLTQGIEVGITGRYVSEQPTIDSLTADGVTYAKGVRVSQVDGRQLSDLKESAMGDTTVNIKVQPAAQAPLVLALEVTVPTGGSRFKSYVRSEYWFRETEALAGNGEGITRLKLLAQYGNRAIKKGLYLFGAFTPAATESFSIENRYEYQAVHPEAVELGVGYTLPWTVLERPGAGMLGARIISRGASRTTKGVYFGVAGDGSPEEQNKYWQGRWENGTGLNPYADIQLELFLETDQQSSGLLGGSGRVFFRSKSRGWDAGIAGQLFY